MTMSVYFIQNDQGAFLCPDKTWKWSDPVSQARLFRRKCDAEVCIQQSGMRNMRIVEFSGEMTEHFAVRCGEHSYGGTA